MRAKFELPLAVLELLAFIAQIILGVTWPQPRPFSKTFQGSCRDFPRSIGAKFYVRSFSPYGDIGINTPKFMGSRDPDHAPFYPLLIFRGWRPPSDVVELWTAIISPQYSVSTQSIIRLLRSWKQTIPPADYNVMFSMNMSRFYFPQRRCLIFQWNVCCDDSFRLIVWL